MAGKLTASTLEKCTFTESKAAKNPSLTSAGLECEFGAAKIHPAPCEETLWNGSFSGIAVPAPFPG